MLKLVAGGCDAETYQVCEVTLSDAASHGVVLSEPGCSGGMLGADMVMSQIQHAREQHAIMHA